ncbi:MAG: hsdS [Rhodococcus erythropolis]|jgi:type I restriction enzyme S subunit|nr:hypothetical protein [Rhodococcus erythropolis]MDF2897940.1 hsdS [Rhodococcus erythropolis]
MTELTNWKSGALDDVLEHVDVRNKDQVVELVLSVTEGRGIVPQSEVFSKRVATDDTSKYKVLRPLDIAWNPYLLWTGAIGQWLGDQAGITSPVYPIFHARKEQDARFWGMVLESGVLTAYFNSRAIGSIVRRRRTTVPIFKEAPTFIPPLPVQERIVKVIGAVDDQIAALGTESDALEGILESLRSDLPETDHQPIGDVLMGIDSGKSVQAGGQASAEDKYRILKLSAVQRGWFKPSEAKSLTEGSAFSPSHTVQNGDLLITRANTPERVGFVAVAKNVAEGTFMPDLIWRLSVDESRVSTDYLEHVLSSRELRIRISGVSGGTNKSMVKINKRSFSTVRVPIPPLSEQSEYVRRCDAVIGGITTIRAEAARLRKVRAGLLSGLLDRTIDIKSANQEV